MLRELGAGGAGLRQVHVLGRMPKLLYQEEPRQKNHQVAKEIPFTTTTGTSHPRLELRNPRSGVQVFIKALNHFIFPSRLFANVHADLGHLPKQQAPNLTYLQGPSKDSATVIPGVKLAPILAEDCIWHL
jgi:hypothetical protein